MAPKPRKRLRLARKNAIVTDGSHDIGKAVAMMFAQEGARVLIGYRSESDKNAAEKTAAAIEKYEGRGQAFAFNTTVNAQRMVDVCINTLGGIDVLVNTGTFNNTLNTTEAAARYMKKQKSGKIINVISPADIFGTNVQAYSAAKTRIVEFTTSTSRELGKHNINVNAICLEMTAEIRAEPEEIAPVFAFMASDDAKYVNGQVLNVG